MDEPSDCDSTDDDIYDDLDFNLNPQAASITDVSEDSSSVSSLTKTGASTITVPSQSSSTSNLDLNETQLKKEEMILYLDLVLTEMDDKKALANIKAEYIKLKKETDSLKKSLSEKDEKISKIAAENITLKKNICSLYKTAKSEIDQKDALLQEANKEIDYLHRRRDKSAVRNEQFSVESSQCQPSTSGIFNVPSQSSEHYEAPFIRKEGQSYKNYKKRSYEISESENPAFKRMSTSFNTPDNHTKRKTCIPPDNHTKTDRVNSKHKFSDRNSEKHKHSLSRDPGNEKDSTKNYTDLRTILNNSKNNRSHKGKERSPKKQRLGS